MAYFDSPKNKALWDKELDSLNAERERRKTEGYKPGQDGFRVIKGAEASRKENTANNPYVRRITLKELEEIEKRAREAEREAAGITDSAQRQRRSGGLSHSNPERQAASASI